MARRRGAVSAFGSGGTNFHVVLEEHVPGATGRRRGVRGCRGVPGYLGYERRRQHVWPGRACWTRRARRPPRLGCACGNRKVSRYAGHTSSAALRRRDRRPAHRGPGGREGWNSTGADGTGPAIGAAPIRVAVDYADAAELAAKVDSCSRLFCQQRGSVPDLLRQRGVYVGAARRRRSPSLYTGQGLSGTSTCSGARRPQSRSSPRRSPRPTG